VEHVEKPRVAFSVNAGIYVLAADVAARVPCDREFAMTCLVEECLERKERVCAYEIQEDWIDVGQVDQLQMARNGTS
jgi:NDP-sugar pyrophosphorylase family protein